MSGPDIETTEDFFLDGNLRLRQPKRGHRAGHDAILLAAAVAAKPGDRVADFGAGVGAAGLAVAKRVPEIDCVLVERDDALAELARVNANLNSIGANVLTLDVTAPADVFAAAGLNPDSVDAVLMNPPFNDESRHRSSPDVSRQTAHVADEDTLARWIHAARRVLKPGGVLTLIWRADGLGEVLAGLERGFGAVTILPVHPDATKPAIRILVSAIKGSGAPMSVRRSLVLNDENGMPSAEAKSALGGQSIALANEGIRLPRN